MCTWVIAPGTARNSATAHLLWNRTKAFRGTTYTRPSSVRWLIVGNAFVKASHRLITRLLVLRDKIRRSFSIKHEVFIVQFPQPLCHPIWNAVLIFHPSDYARRINFVRILNGTFHRNSRPGDWLGLASFLAFSSSRRFRKLAKLHCSSHFPLVLAAALAHSILWTLSDLGRSRKSWTALESWRWMAISSC